MNQGSRQQGKYEPQRKKLQEKDREKVKLLKPEIGLELRSGGGGRMGEDFGNRGGSDSWEQGMHSVAKGGRGLRGPHLYSLLDQ